MKKYARLMYILRLLEMGAMDRMVRASTTFLSKIFEVSQQSASRILKELHSLGYLEKEIHEGAIWLKLTEKALGELRQLREELDSALAHPGVFEFEGRVFSGYSEGAYYVSKKPYRKQFYKRFGFDLYPGTLNILLEEPEQIRLNMRLRKLKGVYIIGFEDVERSYGEVNVFKALMNEEIVGGVIIATRSIYGPDVLEFISPFHLREKLGLKDGDRVRLTVFLTDSE